MSFCRACSLILVCGSVLRCNAFMSPLPQSTHHIIDNTPVRIGSKTSFNQNNRSNPFPKRKKNFHLKSFFDEDFNSGPPKPKPIPRVNKPNNDDNGIDDNIDLISALIASDDFGDEEEGIQIPLLGEIPRDGSIFIFVPAAIIGFLGIVYGIFIAFQSTDAISSSMTGMVETLNKTPMTENVVADPNKCRGLCSNKEDDLELMRGFMEKISKKEAVY
eukprot:CAMPEP_0194365692 /NCGR_PEP_ID=MMETSP0174-20130528/13745_1 /TAXON_ID=216777 /ORGANISM="Proboscia alata, Strain PI-D3" /LENGTH=216 /DNA_ID=CAMNT_0039140515 /DNA_START=61 /DNA_END=711 /DNA_ORIENTATION=+